MYLLSGILKLFESSTVWAYLFKNNLDVNYDKRAESLRKNTYTGQ